MIERLGVIAMRNVLVCKSAFQPPGKGFTGRFTQINVLSINLVCMVSVKKVTLKLSVFGTEIIVKFSRTFERFILLFQFRPVAIEYCGWSISWFKSSICFVLVVLLPFQMKQLIGRIARVKWIGNATTVFWNEQVEAIAHWEVIWPTRFGCRKDCVLARTAVCWSAQTLAVIGNDTHRKMTHG